MTEFSYTPLFSFGKDPSPYRLLTQAHVTSQSFAGQEITVVDAAALEALARAAFSDVNYLYRTHHLESLRRILDDPEASDNDRYVAFSLLKNAVISADRVLPSCQDTGTAKIYAFKGQRVWTNYDDEEALSRGIYRTYAEESLRYSQNAPLSMYEEVNTGTNLPAEIDISSKLGGRYEFLFVAKGGGSANKMFLFQETRALLNPRTFPKWIERQLIQIGTAACPPYHLALVVGGLSAECTMKTLKLATSGYLDNLPTQGSRAGNAYRDLECEQEVLAITRKIGIGAQFGGKYFAHDVKVIRLPRHGASLPVGLGVSCSADRNVRGYIGTEGVYLEQLDEDPARFLPAPERIDPGTTVRIDLERPMPEVLAELSRYPVKTRLMLNGRLIVARDIAHARFQQLLDQGAALPEYLRQHPVYYAGPAKTPKGYVTGSFGPTTAARMDPYVDSLQSRGASMIMLAKGNRSRRLTESCKRHGGFYLGSVGGPAAMLAHECIRSVRRIDFEDLGMEAVWEIRVENFPAFIVVDDKGNDFFAQLH